MVQNGIFVISKYKLMDITVVWMCLLNILTTLEYCVCLLYKAFNFINMIFSYQNFFQLCFFSSYFKIFDSFHGKSWFARHVLCVAYCTCFEFVLMFTITCTIYIHILVLTLTYIYSIPSYFLVIFLVPFPNITFLTRKYYFFNVIFILNPPSNVLIQDFLLEIKLNV